MAMVYGIMIVSLVSFLAAATVITILSVQVAALKRENKALRNQQQSAPVELQSSIIPHWDVANSAQSDDDEVLDLMRRGQKIQAIKLYRERTGVGLKEAKDAVEAMEIRIR